MVGSLAQRDRRDRDVVADALPNDSVPSPAPRRAIPPIVGIGASAGGLDAFLRLLHHIPADTGSALCWYSISTRCTRAYCRTCWGVKPPFQ